MNKDSLRFIIFVLLICDIIFNIVMIIILPVPEINQTRVVTLVNPKPGIHIIRIDSERYTAVINGKRVDSDEKYIQVEIGNYTAVGTFTVSLEMNNFKEGKEIE